MRRRTVVERPTLQKTLRKAWSNKHHTVETELDIKGTSKQQSTPKTSESNPKILGLKSFLTTLRYYPEKPCRRWSVGKVLPTSEHSFSYFASRRKLTHQSSFTTINSHLLQKAKQLYRYKQMTQAISIFYQLNKSYPSPEVLFYLGSAHLTLNQYSQTIDTLTSLISLNPTYSRYAYLLLSIAYKKQRLYEYAVKTLQKAYYNVGYFEQCHMYAAKLHMKLKQYDYAVEAFNKCLKLNHNNALCWISLGDAERGRNNIYQAIAHYGKALRMDSRYHLLALIKRMNAYFSSQLYVYAELDVDELLYNKVSSSYVYFHKGMLLLLRSAPQSSIYFEEALKFNNHPWCVTRSLEYLVKAQINLRDYYQAEHQIQRIKHLNVQHGYLTDLSLFIEGILDGIKKRYKDAISKLEKVRQNIKNSHSYDIIMQNIHLFIAYDHFCLQNYSSALRYYKKEVNPSCGTTYNLKLCYGIILGACKKFPYARYKFYYSKNYLSNRIEPYFYKAVCYVQQYYMKKDRRYLLDLAERELRQGESMNSNNSLFYFYLCILLLHLQKPEPHLIFKAIDKSEDNIAYYYFVKGILQCREGAYEDGLSDLTNALLIDPEGFDLLKERSKCYYMLGRYDDAMNDIRQCLDRNDRDYEAKLLLCFYLYALENFDLALDFLKEAVENEAKITGDDSSGNRISTFIYTLRFRLGDWENAGNIGRLMLSLKTGKAPTTPYMHCLTDHIKNKEILGEFQLSHMLVLQSLIHLYQNKYIIAAYSLHTAMIYIKNCLQEEASDQNSIDSENELRIYEVKFNMIVLTLCQLELEKAMSLIKMLIDDTYMYSLVEKLKELNYFILESITRKGGSDRSLTVSLFDGRFNLLSQDFPTIEIKLSDTYSLRVKPLLFHPYRLNFNIVPEMSEDMLKFFTIDKIEDRPEPPWIQRSSGQSIFFTYNIEMRRSVCVSSGLSNQDKK